ncbi:MAG TPA: PAS domain-containing protein [Chloroflexi bacterium]|nr:PAS domain-containing protein [Chloroflexota bacterium]
MPDTSAQALFISWLSALFLWGAAILNAYLAWRALRKPRRPEGKTLGYLMAAIAWWAFFYGLHIVVPSLGEKYACNIIKYFGAVFAPALWLVMSLQYTRQWETLPTLWKRAIFIIPVISLVIVVSTPGTNLWWRNVKLIPTHLSYLPDISIEKFHGDHTPLYYLHTAVSYLYLVAGAVILWRFQRTSAPIYRAQTRLMITAILVPLVANMFTQVKDFWYWGLDPFFFTITAVLLARAIFRYRLLELIPVARQTVLEQIPEGVIVLDDSATILDINQSAANLLQNEPNGFIGENLLERTPLPMLRSALEDILQNPPEKRLSQEIHLSDQSIRLLKSIPLHYRNTTLGRILVLQDITEQVNARKQMEILYEQAEQERTRLAATLESASEGILLLNTEGKVVSSNPPAQRILPFDDARQFPPPLREAVQEAQETGETVRREISIGQQTFHVGIAPVPDMGVVLTMHDVTPLTEVVRLNNELISILSHDLRGPLSSISGYAQLAQMDNLSRQEYAEIFSRIDASARRLAHFASDILTISRLETGIRSHTPAVPILMDKIAYYIVQDMEGAARSKGLLVHTHLKPHPPIKGETRLIEQMWRNLIDNAIKYTDAGFISVTVKPEGDTLVAQVSDTGRGISPEDLPHIFEKFYRSSGATPRSRGIGLGLSLVKNIVEQHGGTISVESIPGRGTTFTMHFPLEE